MELLNFIQRNKNWKELIQEKPYCITIKEDEKYILLSYSQIESDFSLKLVRECRGIILRKSDLKIVCYPFDKFFNIQETNASFINWNTVTVQQKLDGSIIKAWFDDGFWHLSTNGTINSINAKLQNSLGEAKNYFELFVNADNFPDDLEQRLNVNNSYIFEIVSPWNRIVVPYDKTEIWHLGTRDNNTFEELNVDIGIQKPKVYPLYSATQCLMAAQELPYTEEGWVVCDRNFNRVKIKGIQYVAYHHLRGNGIVNKNRILELIRTNGQDDFKSVFSEYREIIEEIELSILKFINDVSDECKHIMSLNFNTRKEFAQIVNKTKCPPAIFSVYDGKTKNIADWLWKQTNEKILSWIEEF